MNSNKLIFATLLYTLNVSAQNEKYNIIYILADDMGIGDLGCYGQTKIKTPNIDRMAEKGILFTQHYAGASVSAPSRCTLLTGLHTGHCAVRSLPSFTASGNPVDMTDDDTTIADRLKSAGYSTAVIGKWGLAESGMESMPYNRGFDYFFGYKTHRDAHHYYPEYLWRNDEKVYFPDNDTKNKKGKYSNDLFTDEAIKFIKKHASSPFFLYLPYCLPHLEITVPEDSKQQYVNLGWTKRSLGKGHYYNDEETNVSYAGMVSRLDNYVGKIIKFLEETGLDKNTLVFFSSDNGPEYDNGFFSSNAGLKGKKRFLNEGGIRTPLIAYCPGTIPEGVKSNCISAFWDMYPTFAEIAGIPSGKTDGISLFPTLFNKGIQKEHEYLYWEQNMKDGPCQAVRMGKWKAIKFLDKSMLLYDLKKDPQEKFNVANDNSDIVSKIEEILKEAHSENSEYPIDRWVYKPTKEVKTKNKAKK